MFLKIKMFWKFIISMTNLSILSVAEEIIYKIKRVRKNIHFYLIIQKKDLQTYFSNSLNKGRYYAYSNCFKSDYFYKDITIKYFIISKTNFNFAEVGST